MWKHSAIVMLLLMAFLQTPLEGSAKGKASENINWNAELHTIKERAAFVLLSLTKEMKYNNIDLSLQGTVERFGLLVLRAILAEDPNDAIKSLKYFSNFCQNITIPPVVSSKVNSILSRVSPETIIAMEMQVFIAGMQQCITGLSNIIYARECIARRQSLMRKASLEPDEAAHLLQLNKDIERVIAKIQQQNKLFASLKKTPLERIQALK